MPDDQAGPRTRPRAGRDHNLDWVARINVKAMKPRGAESCEGEVGGQKVAPGGQKMPGLNCELGPAIETSSKTSPTLAPQAFGAKTRGARLIKSERTSH